MTDLPAPPLKSLMELRVHLEKTRELHNWIRSRMLEMGVRIFFVEETP